MSRNLLNEPLWTGEDLGKPLPVSDHANSVCLPRWRDVIGYEERDPEVLSALQCGYPRFMFHPFVEAAFKKYKPDHVDECHIYSTRAAAERCQDYLLQKHPEAEIQIFEINGYAATGIGFPSELAATAKEYWQHSGEGISSRCGQALVGEWKVADAPNERSILIQRIADLNGVSPDNVFLLPTGMAAISSAYRACKRLRPDSDTVQFSFPYLDTLKLQERFGGSVEFFPIGNKSDIVSLEQHFEKKDAAALFCEFPTNPLLHCIDLDEVHNITSSAGVPVVVDDTIGGYANVDLLSHTDLLVTSLTKFFSGAGEVMGGAIIINPESHFAGELHKAICADYEQNAYCPQDIRIMEAASRNYLERISAINDTAEKLCEYLNNHPKVESVYYPKITGKEIYDQYKRADGGYGGLFSFVLKNAEKVTESFYDNLQLCKGPNLGTQFTLCCPFTLLAHYDELDFAESCGASQYLIRISTGLEEYEVLKNRLDKALAQIV